jgi:DNA-binding protein YbaB
MDKAGGMFGGMGNIMENMKKAAEVKEKATQLNVELKSTTVIGTDPTKNVKATFDGTGKPLNFKVSDKLAKEGAEAINIAVSQAAIAGHRASQKLMLDKMQQIYKDAGLPAPGAGGMGE